jgi:hypothetical protein
MIDLFFSRSHRIGKWNSIGPFIFSSFHFRCGIVISVGADTCLDDVTVPNPISSCVQRNTAAPQMSWPACIRSV